MAWRDTAIEDEAKRANEQMARADALTARINDEVRRADAAVLRASELERASLDLAGRVDALEQVADRLALRVVEREQEIATDARASMPRWRSFASGSRRRRFESMADGRGNGEKPSNGDARDVFDGLIEVEVGPLSDFDQLASFEDAANGIGAAEEISVKRFTKGRATLEMHLSEPVALLVELEERAPFEFTVRDTRERSRRARRRRRVAGRASSKKAHIRHELGALPRAFSHLHRRTCVRGHRRLKSQGQRRGAEDRGGRGRAGHRRLQAADGARPIRLDLRRRRAAVACPMQVGESGRAT